MDVGTVAVIVVTIVAVAVTHRSSTQAASILSGLFRATELAWPSGVQEDDDACWVWDPPRRPGSHPRSSQPSADAPPSETGYRVALTHVHGSVRRR